MGRAAPPTPDQAAQSPIEPGLEHLQGWGTHSSMGSCGRASLSLSKKKKFHFISNLSLPSFRGALLALQGTSQEVAEDTEKTPLKQHKQLEAQFIFQ